MGIFRWFPDHYTLTYRFVMEFKARASSRNLPIIYRFWNSKDGNLPSSTLPRPIRASFSKRGSARQSQLPFQLHGRLLARGKRSPFRWRKCFSVHEVGPEAGKPARQFRVAIPRNRRRRAAGKHGGDGGRLCRVDTVTSTPWTLSSRWRCLQWSQFTFSSPKPKRPQPGGKNQAAIRKTPVAPHSAPSAERPAPSAQRPAPSASRHALSAMRPGVAGFEKFHLILSDFSVILMRRRGGLARLDQRSGEISSYGL